MLLETKNPAKIWFSAQDHAVLLLLLNTIGFFISARQKSAFQKWFVGDHYWSSHWFSNKQHYLSDLYHSCTSSEGAYWRGQLLNIQSFYMIHRGGRICTIRWPHPLNLGQFWAFLRGGPKFCLQQSCAATGLNKAVPPWRRKSWRKRYSNTMRL